ncbi:MAG: isochorismatase family protein [Solirubrobacteraceae bacterium]
MSLPRIAPYPMPGAAALPANRVTWRPDPDRAALLVHDMQRHFLAPFDRGREPIPQLLANVAALRRCCAELAVPVIYSAQPAGQTTEQRGLLQDFWGDGIADDPAAAAIVDELAPGDDEVVLTKWRYSAFVRTDLLAQLQAAGRDQLVICGVYAHIGCLSTALHAFMQEIEPFVVADAVADFSLDEHRLALRWAAGRCATVTTTAHVLADLRAAGGVTLEQLRADVLAALEQPPAQLAEDDNLVDAGLDSMTLMSLVTAWRARGAEIDFEDLAEAEPTLAAWHGALRSAHRRGAGVG